MTGPPGATTVATAEQSPGAYPYIATLIALGSAGRAMLPVVAHRFTVTSAAIAAPLPASRSAARKPFSRAPHVDLFRNVFSMFISWVPPLSVD